MISLIFLKCCHWNESLQEPLVISVAAASAAEPPGQVPQSPYPHCKLASLQRGASAATSVEAVQQGGDDEDVQGGMMFANNLAGAGATSMPTTSSVRHQRPSHHNNRLPIAPSPRQQSPASNRATSGFRIERGHSVVLDSEYQRAAQSPVSQQQFGLPIAATGRKRHRTESDTHGPEQQQHAIGMLSPECSEASQGPPHTAQRQTTSHAAPQVTQQATIQEVRLIQHCSDSAPNARGHTDK